MENRRMLRKRDFTEKGKVFACIVNFFSKSDTTFLVRFSGRRMLNARMAWGGASRIRILRSFILLAVMPTSKKRSGMNSDLVTFQTHNKALGANS